jgi:hypothetical protein
MIRQGSWLALALLLGWPSGGVPPAHAQEPSAPVRLELTLSRRPPAMVQPAPDPKLAEQDAEKAIAELKVRERSEALVRETLQVPSRRPHLDYDVRSGIQARNIREALRSR